MEDKLKEAAAAYNGTGEGRRLRGYWAVDPSGHICLLRPGASLEEGWRWATDTDQKKAADAEAKRAKAEAERAALADAQQKAEQKAREATAADRGGPLAE